MSAEGRWLAWALRHHPEAAGFEVDEDGWVDVFDVVLAMRTSQFPHMTAAHLERTVAEDANGRFLLTGGRIRATYGHTIDVDPVAGPALPPSVLYHGTATSSLPDILVQGLLPQKRMHVHLSADREVAREVGARHGDPVVLRVDAARMVDDGHQFLHVRRNGQHLWLTPAVPLAYLVSFA